VACDRGLPEVMRQAQIIAYIDDFKLMMIVTLVGFPLLLVFGKPARDVTPSVTAMHGALLDTCTGPTPAGLSRNDDLLISESIFSRAAGV
jgi:hypothetical protein